MTWRRIDLDKQRKQKQKTNTERAGQKSSIKEIKCRIELVFLPGELTGLSNDSRIDANTFRVVVKPVDLSNYGYATELSKTAFVLNEEPHYIMANYGVLGLIGKIATIKFVPPLLGTTGEISLEGILNFGNNASEPTRDDSANTKAFDIGKAILGLLPF